MHKMRLHDEPFYLIKNGSKTIELRLNDEKRQQLSEGDIIEFQNRSTDEVIKVKIIKLHKFDNFTELYKHFDKVAMGYSVDEDADPHDMDIYYSLEEQEKYGVVGIEIKLLDIQTNYVCRVATLEDMEKRWDYLISIASDKDNWIQWKKQNINNFEDGKIIPYYGLLDDNIICEATAMIDSSIVQNSDGLVDDKTAYLSAFRTDEEYKGNGYFSKLFYYMLDDLKSRGYSKVTLGVEPSEIKNREIYKHYGFNEFIKKDVETYPDGEKVEVLYYAKDL